MSEAVPCTEREWLELTGIASETISVPYGMTLFLALWSGLDFDTVEVLSGSVPAVIYSPLLA